jgi:hypothetical protein
MIIGLTGYKGSGKSTVAKYIADEYGFKRVNFKDGLVQEMKEKFPTLLEEIAYSVSMLQQYETGIGESLTVSDMFELKPPLMRKLMQEYGTEVRRADNMNYWVDEWKESVGTANIVTDDVRFQNEYDAVKELGGIIIRVVREDITSGGSHQSETEQESFEADFTIVGEPGSHDAIYKQIDSVIETIKSNVD